MDRTELIAAARQIMGSALTNLESDGYVAIATLLVNKNRTISPILAPMRNVEERAMFGDVLRQMAPELAGIIIVTEAWALKPASLDEVTVPVSQNSNRTECVFVTAQSTCGELTLSQPFKRDKDEKPFVAGDLITAWKDAPNQMTGNFSNLFAAP